MQRKKQTFKNYDEFFPKEILFCFWGDWNLISSFNLTQKLDCYSLSLFLKVFAKNYPGISKEINALDIDWIDFNEIVKDIKIEDFYSQWINTFPDLRRAKVEKNASFEELLAVVTERVLVTDSNLYFEQYFSIAFKNANSARSMIFALAMRIPELRTKIDTAKSLLKLSNADIAAKSAEHLIVDIFSRKPEFRPYILEFSHELILTGEFDFHDICGCFFSITPAIDHNLYERGLISFIECLAHLLLTDQLYSINKSKLKAWVSTCGVDIETINHAILLKAVELDPSLSSKDEANIKLSDRCL